MHKIRNGGPLHSLQSDVRSFEDCDYDAEAIAAEIARIDVVEGQFASLLDFMDRSATPVFYEDICADPKGSIATLCGRIGLRMPSSFEPQVRLGILRDAVSQGWHSRFREDRPACC